MTSFRIGWARKLPGSKAEDQERRLLDAGCDRVWIEGGKLTSGRTINRDWLLMDVRPGDVVMVTDGRLLMAPGTASATMLLTRGLRAIEDRGASAEVLPPPPGLHTRSREARDNLIAHVRERIARARAGGGAGRPSKPFTADELAVIEPIWNDLRIPTNDAARDKVRSEAAKREWKRWRKITTRQINARLGPSGRSALKRKPAKKPKAK